jgi:hypothetical protein
MANIKVHSQGWDIQPAAPTRGAQSDASPTLPAAFLADQASVADEFTARPRPPARGAVPAAGALEFSYDLDPGELAIVAVRHPSGALTFHAPKEMVRRTRGGAGQVRFSVPIRVGAEPATRGLIGKVIKAVVIKVVETAADEAVGLLLPALARAFETATWKKRDLAEGWLSVTRATLAEGALRSGRPGSTAGRSLLLLHGTFSNAAAAFKGLASSDFFERVAPIYGDRIFAFDHFTLSRTPEENARMLLQQLPARSFVFDVVTHSRGGLVLRNLVERASAFGPLSKRFELGRAVLVASPNEGTPLATPGRWEDTVGWVANLLELFPDNPFTTGAEFVANGLVWIARHASGDLPGLHAMDGDGMLIGELQSPPGPPSGAYSALVANYQPDDRVLARLLDTGIDQFFGSANDLVVPSEGGWRVDRRASARIPGSRIGCFGPGGNLPGDAVTHVGFFDRPETARFLVAALSGQPHSLRPVDPLRNLPDRRLLRAKAGVAPPPGARPAAGKRAAVKPPVPAVEPPRLPPLTVTLVNGDLTFEHHPLLIGHYHSTKLTGAERVIDRRIGGTMQRALDLETYPSRAGTHAVFINRVKSLSRAPRPEAVIVVGLGQEGKLRPADLSFSVRQAVLAWSQRVAESRDDRPATIELAATLIGSGGVGVSAGQAAQAISQGVYEANEYLAEQDGEAAIWPPVGHLFLIELYLDRATEAWRAIRLLDDVAPGHFALTDPVAVGTGALSRPLDYGYRGAEYDFVTARTREEANGESSIEYALDTRRARTEVRAQATQGRLVRHLVAAASSDDYLDEAIGRSLFRLLVPVEMEPYLAVGNALQIELDQSTAGIPWELLNDVDTSDDQSSKRDKPWAIRTKLLRKLRSEEFRPNPLDAEPDAFALVIGEPQSPPEYAPLPGARREAQHVYACLAGDSALKSERVKGLFSDSVAPGSGPDARQVVNAFLERPWRIVHIAGHGDLASDDGKPAGVILSDGNRLSATEIKAMRVVPELVFVNCCHLAATENERLLSLRRGPGAADRVRFAASVAEALINIGVRCVVAAGWAVDDEAATTFATSFYKAIVANHRFVDAVALARESAYAFEGNTWAAYQCYGDPDWRLYRDGAEPQARQEQPDEFASLVSSREVMLALETLLVQTTHQGCEKASQRERLGRLEARASKMGWSDDARIAELFARAFAAAGGVDEAIRWYDTLLKRPDGYVSQRVEEQHANLLVRRAWRDVEHARSGAARQAGLAAAAGARGSRRRPAKREADGTDQPGRRTLGAALQDARAKIADAMRTFERLVATTPTAERLSLCGSAMKRLAMVEAVAGNPAAEREAVDAMTRYYLEAIGLETPKNLFYPGLNYLAAELALHAGEPGWVGLDPSRLSDTRASLATRNAASPDFWSVVGEVELSLYEAVAQGTLARSLADLERAYRDVHHRSRGGSEWGSVVDTAGFVLSRYAPRASGPEQEAAGRVMALLRDLAGVPHGDGLDLASPPAAPPEARTRRARLRKTVGKGRKTWRRRPRRPSGGGQS